MSARSRSSSKVSVPSKHCLPGVHDRSKLPENLHLEEISSLIHYLSHTFLLFMSWRPARSSPHAVSLTTNTIFDPARFLCLHPTQPRIIPDPKTRQWRCTILCTIVNSCYTAGTRCLLKTAFPALWCTWEVNILRTLVVTLDCTEHRRDVKYFLMCQKGIWVILNCNTRGGASFC